MITPLDIENKKFAKQMMNGYNVDEVDDFLDELTLDYGKLYKENAELKDRVSAMQESVSYYKSIEEGISKTIENANEAAEDIKTTALREIEGLKREAESEAQKSLDEIRKQIIVKEAELEEKKKQMQIYKIRVSAMLEAQLEILKEED